MLRDEFYLKNLPDKKVLRKIIAERATCTRHADYGRICEDIFKEMNDWCTGCLLKGAADWLKSI